MNFQFKIQDPSNSGTTYLLEEIIGLIRRGNLKKWRGIYSWTTGKTLTHIFLNDPDVIKYLKKGNVELIIGLDAITTDYALKELSNLNNKYKGFNSKLFHNDISNLFHPKISHFEFENGEHVLLVGSGNFTLSGLQSNIEAYTITTGYKEDIPTLDAWDNFLTIHNDRLKEIDAEAFKQAENNRVKIIRKRNVAEAEVTAEEAAVDNLQEEVEEIVEMPIAARLGESSRVLIAQVPNAGKRWRQINFTLDIINHFFQAQPHTQQRIFLEEVRIDGTHGNLEIRPIVSNTRNTNLKIEVSSRSQANYPDKNRPIIVFKEVGVRNFLYMLILPQDTPYNCLHLFLECVNTRGRGMKRVITDSNELRRIWNNCPLVE